MKRISKEIKKIESNGAKVQKFKSKIAILQHLSKKNCVLLPFLDEDSLHAIGEFVFNVITQRLKLNKRQEKRVRNILNRDKKFYSKLVDKRNKKPLTYLRTSLREEPQVGRGIVSMLAALAPVIAGLILK